MSFSDEDVAAMLMGLATDKSAGPDGMHPMLLKSCAQAIAWPLSLIFSASFNEGEVPTDWKIASIAPIYKKKGRRTDPANYRPVSLTSVPCKIMESMIKVRMTKFIENNNLLSTHQHGFIQHRSCLTNLLEAMESWTESLDNGYGVDAMFLDYRKAFDTVSHMKLLEKLSLLGIQDKLLKWIEKFLTGRTMKVSVRGSFSEPIDVVSGVPQGSVLGPMLFLLFVNDLPDWIQSKIKMFADDTKMWASIKIKEDSNILQKDQDSLTEWSKKWLLKFNAGKCKIMHIGHSIPTEYYMEDDLGQRIKMEEINMEKDLGIHIPDDLKSETQCRKAAGKARSILAMVKRNFRRLDEEDFLLIYKTYIRPHLEYCVQAWSPHLAKDIQTGEKIQRSATKFVPSLKKFTYEDRLKKLDITSLEKRRIRDDLVETNKILTDKEKIDSNQFFKFSDSGHDLN